MKYIRIDENSGKILGYRDDTVHSVIPSDAKPISEEQLQNIRNNGHNKINMDGTTELFDFRTDEEKTIQFETDFRVERNNLINEVDIEINKALDNGLDVTILRQYRQALRDATIAWVLPTKPY